MKFIRHYVALGTEIYPNRTDLKNCIFWKCDNCNGYVGSHQGTRKKLPLGCIPSEEIKNARRHIHNLLDPIWENNRIRRGKLYKLIGDKLGYKYHTAEIRDIEEARKIYKIILEIKKWIEKKKQ